MQPQKNAKEANKKDEKEMEIQKKTIVLRTWQYKCGMGIKNRGE